MALTPKPVRMPATAAKASETPLEYLLDADIVDSVAGMPSESENGEGHNAGEYDDEGYESPSKQPGDYSDDSTVSWMIERQLKGTIDASLEIPPEQLRIGAESIVDARMPQISKASGAAASGKAADDDNRASTAKSRENTNADWREAEQLSDTGNGRSSAGIDVSRVQPHPLLRGSWLTIALTITALLVPTLLLQDSIRTMPKRISPWWPLHLSPFSTDPATSLTNVTADYADTFHRFSSQVDRQISHLTRDINVLRSEWSQKLPVLKELSDAFHRVPNAPADPLATPRVNFLSPSLGTRVDRDMTSPTWAGRTGGGGGLLSRLRRAVASSERASPNGPETVLEAWHDAGDCWCSPMSQGGTQIAFKLGKPIVPEEIIVEHVPQSATLDAAATPQDMELWVQFAYMQAPSDSEHSLYDQVETVLAFDPRMVEDDETWQDPSEPTPPSASSLASSIYDALSAANSVEEPTAFTQDTLLGPTFFRIAKWRYEVGDSGTGIHHIQRFGLDANVDLPRVRAVQAVVKVASTWADEEHKGVGDHVCLYRIRLHGHT
ncbi:hypothetical protein KEM52_002178 [Ascosphaera acerosa]|nr:hypothetical protein KEM52_002178 [Ascosphaera acerosa]